MALNFSVSINKSLLFCAVPNAFVRLNDVVVVARAKLNHANSFVCASYVWVWKWATHWWNDSCLVCRPVSGAHSIAAALSLSCVICDFIILDRMCLVSVPCAIYRLANFDFKWARCACSHSAPNHSIIIKRFRKSCNMHEKYDESNKS